MLPDHRLVRLALALLFCLAPLPAFARSLGAEIGAGFDLTTMALVHLAGFGALGLWAGQASGADQGRAVLGALVAAVAAGILGRFGVHLPSPMLLLALAVIIQGGLAATAARLPGGLAILVAASTAVPHGYLAAGAAPGWWAAGLFWLGYASGVLIAAAAGLGLGVLMTGRWSAAAPRLAGAMVAALGVLMLFGRA